MPVTESQVLFVAGQGWSGRGEILLGAAGVIKMLPRVVIPQLERGDGVGG